jgi:hypothetical protein
MLEVVVPLLSKLPLVPSGGFRPSLFAAENDHKVRNLCLCVYEREREREPLVPSGSFRPSLKVRVFFGSRDLFNYDENH